MTDFDALWRDGNPDAVGGADEPPAPGTYDPAALEGASIFTSRSAGEPWMKFQWRDLASGHAWSVLYGFRRPAQVDFAKSAARDLGVDVDSVNGLDELNEALGALVGSFYRLEVVDGGNYQNSTYIRGRAQTEAPTAAVSAGRPTSPVLTDDFNDDDIPF